MIKKVILVLAIVISVSSSSFAETPGAKRFGLGVVLGSPTALTGKYWVSNLNAIDFGVSFATSYWFQFYGDYLWAFPSGFGTQTKFISQLIPYLGVGGGLYSWNPNNYQDRPWGWKSYNNSGVGIYVRVPLGVEWYPIRPPLGVFFELSPGIALLPGAWLTLDIGLGIRFYF